MKQRLSSFPAWKRKHIPRNSNEKADALDYVAASLPITEHILLPIYHQPASSIVSPQINQVDKDPSPPPPPPLPSSWMDRITLYLSTRQLPSERDKANKLQVQSGRFSLVDGKLFKRSLGGPYLKCLTPEQS